MNDELRRARIGIFAGIVVMLTIAIVYRANTGPYYGTYEWADYAATAIFILLFGWCLTPNLRLDGHLDDAGNSFALRLGKATKHGLRRLKIRR